jgi:hypothetical protein
MNAWSSCSPESRFALRANSTIRPQCAAKKPTDKDAVARGAPVTNGVVTDGVFAGGAGRRMLAA